MELTCGVATVIFVVAFSLSGRILPRLFTGQCTSEMGMCTPTACECTLPRVKRELVTQDAVPCFQCVDEFCPAVAEGDSTCSSGACECEDPTWPRRDAAQAGSPPCWQCVHPAVDFTARPGGAASGGCLAGSHEEGGLKASDNSTECLVFRYNGAVIMDKASNRSCLAWAAEGARWRLAVCPSEPSADKALRFRQSAPSQGSPSETFCTGPAESEACLEAAEYMCTVDSTQCTMGHCRCENSSWFKQELQTLNGTTCYTCAPPVASCPVHPETCTTDACECRDPNLAKVALAVTNSTGGKAACYSCRPRQPPPAPWASTTVTFVFCIFVGLIAGCCLQRLWAPLCNAASPKGGRRRRGGASSGPRSWHERAAERLEEALEAVCALLVQTGSLFAWARPPLRYAGHAISWTLDRFDDMLEPVYWALDVGQAKVGDWMDAVRDRCSRASAPVLAPVDAGPRKSAGKAKAAAAEASQDAPARKVEGGGSASSSSSSVPGRNPILKAAACVMESAEPEFKKGLSWDPLDLSGSGPAPSGPAVTIPKEWMLKMITPGLVPGKPGAPGAAPAAPPAGAAALPTQRRALRRLQQRREAAAAAAAAGAGAGQSAEQQAEAAPVDESWIDELEQTSARAREPKPKAAGKKDRRSAKGKRASRPVGGSNAGDKEEHVSAAGGGDDSEDEEEREEAAAGGGAARANLEEEAQVAGLEREDEEDEEEEEEEDEDEADAATEQAPHTSAAEEAAGVGALGQKLPDDGDSVQSADAAGGSKISSPHSLSHADEGEVGEDVSEAGRLPSEPPVSEAARSLPSQAGAPAAGSADAGAGEALERTSRATPRTVRQEASAAPAQQREKGKGAKGGADAAPEPAAKAKAKVLREEEAKAKEAEIRAKAEADKRAKEVAERKAREKEEAKRKAKEEADRKAKEEAERQAKEDAERKAREEARRRAKDEAERRAKEELERKAREEAEKKAKEAAERKAKEDAKRKAREEAKAEAERKAREEAKAKEEAERKAKGAGKVKWSTEGERRAEGEDAEPASASAWGPPPSSEPAPVVKTSKPLAADAPEFVPFAMQRQQQQQPPVEDSSAHKRDRRSGRRGRQLSGEGGQADGCTGAAGDAAGGEALPITTVMISGINAHHTPDSFRAQLDTWGMLGTYDFFFMPSGQDHMGTGYAFVNFIDPTFATLCQWIFQQYPVEGTATPFHVQGLDSNIAHWSQFLGAEDMANTPLIIQSPSPSQWAVNGVNMMLNSKFSPQIREQFHKTKMCVFHKKNKCALGASCPFAHSKDELQAVPDLAKTKLCYNYFRRRCNDSKCKFAHGYQELRATDGVYKTELCRWWSYGSCKAGDACRYAHGVEELRSCGGPAGAMPFMPGMGDFGDFSDAGMSGMGGDEGMTVPWGQPPMQSTEMAMPSGFPRGMGSMRQQPVFESESQTDNASDMGMSDISTALNTGDTRPRRQQTAPAQTTTTSSDLTFSGVTDLRRRAEEGAAAASTEDSVVLRVKGTFMEAVHLDTTERSPPMAPARRSWSDGDLRQLCEVMEALGELDEEF